jgi:hypothetical protein
VDGSHPIIAASNLTFQPELIDGFGEHFLKASEHRRPMVFPYAPAPHFALCTLNGPTLTASLCLQKPHFQTLCASHSRY